MDDTELDDYLKYVVGQPGGPAGPFYSVVRSDGRVIAMQIVSEDDARLLADALARRDAERLVENENEDFTSEMQPGEG